jgi:hypothetical protein
MYTLQISSEEKKKKEREREKRERESNRYHTVDCHAKARRTITKKNELKVKMNNDY